MQIHLESSSFLSLSVIMIPSGLFSKSTSENPSAAVAVGDFSDADEDSYRRISYGFSVDVLRLPRIFTMYVGHLLLRIRRPVLFQSSICCWRQ